MFICTTLYITIYVFYLYEKTRNPFSTIFLFKNRYYTKRRTILSNVLQTLSAAHSLLCESTVNLIHMSHMRPYIQEPFGKFPHVRRG